MPTKEDLAKLENMCSQLLEFANSKRIGLITIMVYNHREKYHKEQKSMCLPKFTGFTDELIGAMNVTMEKIITAHNISKDISEN